MDVDAFVAMHRPAWSRMDQLVKNARSLDGAGAGELVELYERVSTDLSLLRSAGADPAVVGWLSSLVGRARTVITGAHAATRSDFVRFWTVSFPVVAYRAWRWWLATAVAFVIVAIGIAVWLAGNPEAQSAIATPDEIDQLVNHDFESYYSEHPAASFAFQVWTNNAWVAARCIAFAVVLGLPIPLLLLANAANLGVSAGFMFAAGKGPLMLGLLAPHGLLELTAVFLAGAVGMRLGWQVIAPGDRPRGQVLAEQGRAVVAVALGLVAVLAAAGLLEALVTPSPLPTWLRVGIGIAVEVAFLTYVIRYGRRAAVAGETGDVASAPDVVPTA